jgi:glutathione peroxidase
MSAAAEAAPTAFDFSFDSIEGGTLRLAEFRGRVLLVVNTASFCGFTPQYRALQALHDELSPRGLTVIGVPSGDFNQESADNATVRQFCEGVYGIDFPLAGLTHVRGPRAHPFYAWVRARGLGEPRWNFFKVLVARDGTPRALFGSADAPDGARLRGAVLAELGRG